MTPNRAALQRAEADPEAVIEAAERVGLRDRLHAIVGETGVAAMSLPHDPLFDLIHAADRAECMTVLTHTESLGLSPAQWAMMASGLMSFRKVMLEPGPAPIGFSLHAEAIAFSFCHCLARLPDTNAEADEDGNYPSMLATVVRSMPQPLASRHVHAPAVMRGTRTHGPFPLARAPALAFLVTAPLEATELNAVKVDGEPLVPPTPEPRALYRRVRPPPGNDCLFGGPRSLDGERIEDVLIAALADMPLTGDERSPLRSDIHKIALAAFALTGATSIPDEVGAIFLGGSATEANINRWHAAVRVGRALTVIVNPRTGAWRDLMIASAHNGGVDVEPPRWWTKDDGAGRAWRLSGGLWRHAQLGPKRSERGTHAGFWGGLHRTIAGLESALTWGATAGRGKSAQIPDALLPEREGGPGPEVFVPWHAVLRLSGEPVGPDTPYKGGAGTRYDARINGLIGAGYEIPSNASGALTRRPAPAGDTIEIHRIKGRRGRTAGVMVRASARFSEAYAKAMRRRNLELLPATRLFPVDPE